jgi:2-keto-4-pentenoate hydratase
MDISFERAADSLAEVRTSHRPLESFPDEATPGSVEDAYGIQDVLVKKLGGRIVGWKIGCTSKMAQESTNTDQPFYGRMFAETTHVSPGEVSFENVFAPIVEPEIAFRFGKDLTPGSGPFSVEDVSDAIDCIFPAFEIVDCRYAHGWPITLFPTIADNGVHAVFIMGEELKDWLSIDRPAIKISAEVNGTFITDGVGTNALEDPMNCLMWLVNSCTSREHSILAGDFVTTGNTANKAILAEPGDTVVASFSGLGDLQVRFD